MILIIILQIKFQSIFDSVGLFIAHINWSWRFIHFNSIFFFHKHFVVFPIREVFNEVVDGRWWLIYLVLLLLAVIIYSQGCFYVAVVFLTYYLLMLLYSFFFWFIILIIYLLFICVLKWLIFMVCLKFIFSIG